MQEIFTTVVGNVVKDVQLSVTSTGVPRATFRIASTSRRFDRTAGRWADGDTTWLGVTAFRWLAEHVAASVHKGDPVIVHGRLRVREWSDGVRSGIAVEIDADSVGHDLSRGTAKFARVRRVNPAETEATVPQESAAGAAVQADPVLEDGAAA